MDGVRRRRRREEREKRGEKGRLKEKRKKGRKKGKKEREGERGRTEAWERDGDGTRQDKILSQKITTHRSSLAGGKGNGRNRQGQNAGMRIERE